MILFLLACDGDDIGLDDTPCERACDAVWDCADLYNQKSYDDAGLEMTEEQAAQQQEHRASCKEECAAAEEQVPSWAEEWIACVEAVPEAEDYTCYEGGFSACERRPCPGSEQSYESWTAQGNAPEDYVCKA